MENQKLDPAASQPYPWYDDRVETVRKEYVNPWADDAEEPKQYTPKEIYDYLGQHIWKQEDAKRAASIIMYQCLQGIVNVRFDGLDGTEDVTSVKEAVGLLKIRNPAVTFSEDVHRGVYNEVPDAAYNRMLETIKYISSLWYYTEEPGEVPPKFEMNALMLLANAIEALSRFNVQYQMP